MLLLWTQYQDHEETQFVWWLELLMLLTDYFLQSDYLNLCHHQKSEAEPVDKFLSYSLHKRKTVGKPLLFQK